MWMYLPDYAQNGSMNVIDKVMDRDGTTVFWEEDPYCGGFTINHDTCYLRNSEMLLVPYTPI